MTQFHRSSSSIHIHFPVLHFSPVLPQCSLLLYTYMFSFVFYAKRWKRNLRICMRVVWSVEWRWCDIITPWDRELTGHDINLPRSFWGKVKIILLENKADTRRMKRKYMAERKGTCLPVFSTFFPVIQQGHLRITERDWNTVRKGIGSSLDREGGKSLLLHHFRLLFTQEDFLFKSQDSVRRFLYLVCIHNK